LRFINADYLLREKINSVAKKRILIRKKETERAHSWNERATSFLAENRKNITYLSAGIIVLVVLTAGVIYYFKNYEKRALQTFTEATMLYNDEIQKGETRDNSKIIETFKNIIDSYPRSKVASFVYLFLAETYYKTGEFPKALDSYEAFMKDNRDDDLTTFALYGIGKVYESMGKLEDALKSFESVSERGGELSTLVLKDLGRLMEQQNRLEEAKGKYREFIELNPGSPFKTEIMYKISQL
jgi:predicted negative regulator of RcsB-dependent stress response